ncbi:MAG: BatA domain-containing protein [Bacteroidia bacterium]|nr:BatA domain-containing protein [Bacteroidia bacterium]
MSFLFPGFLFALSAVSIPIIIHLFNFRKYKTVYFSNIKFLWNIKQETKAKSQLKHLLVLLCRILAIASLVLAFAQPYIPVSGKIKSNAKEIAGIYLDNSFSMEAESSDGNVLEVAKNKIRNITGAYRAGTEFLFLTNDFDPRHQHLVNKNQLFEFLNEVKVSPDVRKMSEIVSRMTDFMNREKLDNRTRFPLYLVSDFQKTTANISQIKNDTSFQISLIPVSAQSANNLYIDSCWFEAPGRKYNQAEELLVRIVNKSGESYQNIPVKLYINDSLKSLSSFNIEKNTSENLKLSYVCTTKGIINGRIEIVDYPVTYDNTFYFSYSLADKIRVLTLSDNTASKYLNALFSKDNYVDLTSSNSNNINYSGMPGYNLIILDEIKSLSSGFVQELVSFIGNGGTVLFFPSSNGDIESYNRLFSSIRANIITGISSDKINIDKVNFDADIYRDVFTHIEEKVDLPVVYKHFVFTKYSHTSQEAILSARDENIFFRSDYQKGRIYISAVPTDEHSSTFAKHPVFVPTVFNIALNSQTSGRLYFTIGNDESIDISNLTVNDYNLLHISNLSGKFDFIPEHKASEGSVRLFVHGVIRMADNYLVKSQSKPVTGVSFNYNRSESDLACYDSNELKEIIAKNDLKNFNIIDAKDQLLTNAIQQTRQGKQLWKIFIILSLIFIGCEIAILRLWKK